MYMNGNERNKIVLLQTSLLLGFYHSEIDEHVQPWYWTGIAISICQILGLHRNPDFSKRNPSISERQRSSWRRLWWSCVFRDRWLSLTMGRPLRINMDDCDTPFPSPDDLLYDIAGLQDPIFSSYIPSDMGRLAEYWVMLISLSLQLGKVLAMNYRTIRPKPSAHEIGALEKQLLQCGLPDQYEAGLTRASRFHSNHVHLHYQFVPALEISALLKTLLSDNTRALLITFYRPLGNEVPHDLRPAEKEDWQHRMRMKADAAASRANEILETLVQEGLLYFAGPMTPPLLIPAMQTHLLQCKSGDALSKRIRLNKLEMCMLVMEELQKTYTVASIYRGIFVKAIEQIFPGYSAPTTYPNAIAAPTAPLDPPIRQESFPTAPDDSDQIARFEDTQTGDVDGNDLMSALMDEASIFNFWETWNQN
ncbi:fungal-specific transcription factor domain-containing protein [Penicillium sp. IBT 18751x]|nr:fungal-specific transcription factor domain-containing protein [Penicillium sp. IBT 18751x]